MFIRPQISAGNGGSGPPMIGGGNMIGFHDFNSPSTNPLEFNTLIDRTPTNKPLLALNFVTRAPGLYGQALFISATGGKSYGTSGRWEEIEIADNAWSHLFVYKDNGSVADAWLDGVWWDAQTDGRAQWKLTVNSAGNGFQFSVGNNDGGFSVISVDSGDVGLTSGQRYFILLFHDPDTNQIGISVNGGTPVYASVTGGVYMGVPGTRPYEIGYEQQYAGPQGEGYVDMVAFYNYVLPADTITWLYNGGLGRSLDDMVCNQPDWTYTDRATAKASGDAWADGDLIRLDNGVSLLYQESLAVDGFSGLIHANPFHSTVKIGSATRLCGGDTGDPDSWTGYTDFGTGVKGTAYDYITDSGDALIYGRAGGAPDLRSDVLGSATDYGAFFACEKANHATILDDGGGAYIWLGGADNQGERAYVYSFKSKTEWTYGPSDYSNHWLSDIPCNASNGMYVYVKDGERAAWEDEGYSPGYLDSDPYTRASTSAMLQFTGQSGKQWNLRLGAHAAGSLSL